jgi:hypothetical protein
MKAGMLFAVSSDNDHLDFMFTTYCWELAAFGPLTLDSERFKTCCGAGIPVHLP